MRRRAATGSDDTSLVFYHGAPFKFNTSLRMQHNRFVYGVAFSPDGSLLVSVGADRKIWLYDGQTGEAKGQVGAGEHKGSIFGVSWAKDSKRFVTSSADQTVKIWDAELGKCTQAWRMGGEDIASIRDHQVGVNWPAGRSDGLILSLNLAGDLSYLNEGTPSPQRIVQGHQKNITTVDIAAGGETLWTGSSEGRVCCWDTATGAAEIVEGEAHTNYVSGIAMSSAISTIYSVGWDDKLRSLDISAKGFIGGASKTDGQPRAIAVVGDYAIVATHQSIEAFRLGVIAGSFRTKYSPTTLAATGSLVTVGGDDSTLHVYSFSLGSGALSAHRDIPEMSSHITTLSFSPDASLLAAGFSNGKIIVYRTEDWTVVISRWSAHTSRVNSIRWNNIGTYAVSGGLDGSVYIWSVAKPGMRIAVQHAHQGGVNGTVWMDEKTVISVGGDGCVKSWIVEGLS